MTLICLNFINVFFNSIKKIEIIKLREIIEFHDVINDNFENNVLRNCHRNVKNRWMIIIMNINMKFLIFNLNIILNNINKNIWKVWIEIILKKKLSIFEYKNERYFEIEWKFKDEEIERCIWSTFWNLYWENEIHWNQYRERFYRYIYFYIRNKYMIYIYN